MIFILYLSVGFLFIHTIHFFIDVISSIIRRDYIGNKNELENKDKDQEKEKEKEKEKLVIKYEDKYVDKLLKMESREIPKEELDTYTNKIVMENTPLGNVLMYWDNQRETFVYYSDMNVPYRILEVVSRKYVTMNNCKSIFIDMNDELEISKKKIEDDKKKIEDDKKKIEEDKKILEEKRDSEAEEDIGVNNPVEEKKSVFAKLKNYNTDNNKSNSIILDSKKTPTNANKIMNTNTNTSAKQDYILKERANRYSYEGKIMNFQFLKKVDKKLVDKNYTMSFTEFKNLQNKN